MANLYPATPLITREEWEQRYAAQVMKCMEPHAALAAHSAVLMIEDDAERAGADSVLWTDPEKHASSDMRRLEEDGIEP